MRGCDEYKKSKKLAALGSKPKAGSTPSDEPPKSIEPDCVASLREFEMAMHKFTTKQEAPQRPQQLRRSTLQAVEAQVVDRYQASAGTVTSTMRGDAKRLIEQQLVSLPLEELPFDEVCELAAAISDRLFAPIFKREAQEAAQQRAEQESRHRKRIEDMVAGHQAAGRKATLIEQAVSQARAWCDAQQIVGPNRLSVLVDIESQLTEFLTGNETIPDAHAIIQTVIGTRFIAAEATQDAARTKADERWYEDLAGLLVLGVFLATSLLARWYPTQTLAILNWIQRTFGLNRSAEAGAPKPSEAAPPTTPNMESRPRSKRRRKCTVTPPNPWANSVGGEPGNA